MTILSATPGRVRLHVAHLKNNYPLFFRLEQELTLLRGIRKVSIRPLTGHLLIHYDADLLCGEELLGYLKKLVQDVERKEADLTLIFAPSGKAKEQEAKASSFFFKRIALNAMKDLMPKPLGWFF